MSGRNIFLAISTIFASVLLCVLVIEVGIRLFVPKLYWPSRVPWDDWQMDSLLGWVQKPNLNIVERTEYGWVVRFQTNQDGCTPGTSERQKVAGKSRIMIFGDSVVVGRSVPQEKTVSAQLEGLLKEKGINVEVINAGVQGYGTDQCLLRMGQLLPLYRPDIVIYGLCQNDFEDNQLIENCGQAKPVFKMTRDGNFKMVAPVLKEGIRPAGFGLQQLIRETALYRLLRPAIFEIRRTIGKLDVKRQVISLDGYYYDQEMIDNKIDWNLFIYLINQMKMISDANGARFCFYAHPALQEVWEPAIKQLQQSMRLKPGQYDRYAIEKRLRKIAEENGLLFIPQIDYFLRHESEGPFHLLPLDPHCNQTGYRLTAQVLFSYCSRLLPANTASQYKGRDGMSYTDLQKK